MAEFKQAVLTNKGIALLAKAQAEHATIQISKAVTGNGVYEEGEDIAARTSLKSSKQEFAPTTILRQNETNVFVQFSITNNPAGSPLLNGYYVTEIGLCAIDPDEGEILYSIAVGAEGRSDYLPAYNNLLPAVIGVDYLIEVANSEDVTITTDLSAYATRDDLNAKADGIGYDGESDQILLKANNETISRVTLPLSGYAKKTDLEPFAEVEKIGMDYSQETSILSLEYDGREIAHVTIVSGGGGDYEIATHEDIEEIVDQIMHDAPPTPEARIATEEEIEETIEELDDL